MVQAVHQSSSANAVADCDSATNTHRVALNFANGDSSAEEVAQICVLWITVEG